MRKEKVGIISIHYGVNFGSSLQAIALSQYLKKNFEFERVDVINYIPKRFKRINRLKNISGHGAKYFMHGLIRMSRFEKTNKKYISYLKENISVSKPIYSMREAKAEFGDYDYLIAGTANTIRALMRCIILALLLRIQRRSHMRLVVGKRNIQTQIGIRYVSCWRLFRQSA